MRIEVVGIFGTHKAHSNLGITQTGLVSTGKFVGNTLGKTCLKIHEEEGRAVRKDLGNNEQVVLLGSEIGKSA